MDHLRTPAQDLPRVTLPHMAILLSGLVGDGRSIKYGWQDYGKTGRGKANGIWKRANTNQKGALEWSSYAIPQATTKNRFHPLWSGSETSNYGANGGETISERLRSINQDKVIFGNLSETVNDAFTQVFRQQRLSDWTTLGSDESHWTGFWVKLEDPEWQPSSGDFIKANSIQLVRIDDAIVTKEKDPLTGDDVTNLELVGTIGTIRRDGTGGMHATMANNVGSSVVIDPNTGDKKLETPLYLRFNDDTTQAFKIGSKTPKLRQPPAVSTLLGGVNIINFPFSGF